MLFVLSAPVTVVDVPHVWGEQGRLSSDPGWWYGRGGVDGGRLNDAVSSSDVRGIKVVDDVVEVLGVFAR